MSLSAAEAAWLVVTQERRPSPGGVTAGAQASSLRVVTNRQRQAGKAVTTAVAMLGKMPKIIVPTTANVTTTVE